MLSSIRKTTQALAPARRQAVPDGQYDIYPGFDVGRGKIDLGWAALAGALQDVAHVTLDGFGGVLWDDLRAHLEPEFAARGVRTCWRDVASALKAPDQIDALIAPFLGGDDPLFGRRFTGELRDFFDPVKLALIQPDPTADLNIVYGCGAALCHLAVQPGALVYIDVPKNEVQYRSRAGSVANLGADCAFDPKAMYKRFYFVDWPALGRHKRQLLPRIDLIVDGQRPDEPAVMNGDDFRAALAAMSRSCVRARPWFEPGPWGGQWLKRRVPQLPQEAPNYAWSFELIAPENGLILCSDGVMLEASFDCLLFHDHRAVLGASADRFGFEFPIRFDFLDTFDGGNLSVQCHPRPEYARRFFGEAFTQDETYYILDCAPGARVYLGFEDDVDPATFRAVLETSSRESTPVDVERFVNVEPAHVGDLFLIPNGTIHCSGANNLVLEISATPYIFTFKMYDWMRLDLDGRPRPLNIGRAFDNLCFERRGDRVRGELISHPRTIAEGPDWRVSHLPTHPEHYYDVHRLEFSSAIEVETDDSVQVMNLVAGECIALETAAGMTQRFSYAETFVVSAAAGRFRLNNLGNRPATVVKAFIKP
jgi:mannose-6-phosphate isomerase class I